MKDGFESLGRVRAQGIALLAVTFLVGVLAGIAGERVRASRRAEALPPPPELGMLQPLRPGRLPALFDRLDLTPEQRVQVRDIMESARTRTDRVTRDMLPQLRAVTDSVRDELREVLTPKQVARFDSLMTRMRWRGQRPGPGRRQRGGPPPEPI